MVSMFVTKDQAQSTFVCISQSVVLSVGELKKKIKGEENRSLTDFRV